MDSTSVFLESFVAALRISRNILSREGIDMYRHCTLAAPKTLWRKMAWRNAIAEEDIGEPLLFFTFFSFGLNRVGGTHKKGMDGHPAVTGGAGS